MFSGCLLNYQLSSLLYPAWNQVPLLRRWMLSLVKKGSKIQKWFEIPSLLLLTPSSKQAWWTYSSLLIWKKKVLWFGRELKIIFSYILLLELKGAPDFIEYPGSDAPYRGKWDCEWSNDGIGEAVLWSWKMQLMLEGYRAHNALSYLLAIFFSVPLPQDQTLMNVNAIESHFQGRKPMVAITSPVR